MANRMVERLLASGTLMTVSKLKLTRTRIILAFAVSVIADVRQFPISSMHCPQGGLTLCLAGVHFYRMAVNSKYCSYQQFLPEVRQQTGSIGQA